MQNQILLGVQAIVRTELNDQDIELGRETTADDVPFWDSLAHVRIMVAVEKTFGVRFRSEELNSYANVGELADAIAAKGGKAP